MLVSGKKYAHLPSLRLNTKLGWSKTAASVFAGNKSLSKFTEFQDAFLTISAKCDQFCICTLRWIFFQVDLQHSYCANNNVT